MKDSMRCLCVRKRLYVFAASVESSEGKVCGGQAKLMLLNAKGFRGKEGICVCCAENVRRQAAGWLKREDTRGGCSKGWLKNDVGGFVRFGADGHRKVAGERRESRRRCDMSTFVGWW